MAVDEVKSTYAKEAVYMEEVDVIEEDIVAIHIAPTTPGVVLIFDRFLGISAALIGMLFRETSKHMLAVNAAVKNLVADVVIKVHAGGVAVVEYNKFQKLILIGLTLEAEDVVAEDADHRMARASEEERIESQVISH